MKKTKLIRLGKGQAGTEVGRGVAMRNVAITVDGRTGDGIEGERRNGKGMKGTRG